MQNAFDDLKVGISKKTMREQIADKLSAMIRSGLLREGDELPSERELSATLSVSRETIRSALQALATLGMIEIAHGSRSRVVNRGRWTSPASTAAGLQAYRAEDVYGARKVVEIAVVQTAALSLPPQDLARMHVLVDAQAHMHIDPVAFQISDIEFHAIIYEAGGNPLLRDFLTDVYGYSLDLRRQALLVPGAVKRSWLDHVRILDALDKRDPSAAALAMSHHLARVHRTTQLMSRGEARGGQADIKISAEPAEG